MVALLVRGKEIGAGGVGYGAIPLWLYLSFPLPLPPLSWGVEGAGVKAPAPYLAARLRMALRKIAVKEL